MTALESSFVTAKFSLKNRIVLPPITNSYGSPDGMVTEDILQFYETRSKDVGLVIVESTAVQQNGRIVPGSLGLWNDNQALSMSTLVESIKANGAFSVVQLNHAGPRCTPLENERYGLSPSGVRFRPDVAPVVMTAADIAQLVTAFTRAAVRARDAGFDGIEIHGAHLYLLSQFLSPLTNKRTDRYGADLKGRVTLAVEIVRAVRQVLGQSFPIFFRLNAVERIKGGLTLQDALTIGKILQEAGVDLLDVSLIAQGGWRDQADQTFLWGSSALAKDEPFGANIELAAEFKAKLDLPVIAVGKLADRTAIDTALIDKHIDLLAIGRQMICDPDTAAKVLNRRFTDIIPCQECMKCFTTIGRGDPMACKVNKNLPA